MLIILVVGLALATAALWFVRRSKGSSPMLVTEYEGIEYTHRVLWQIVEDQARLAAQRERDWFAPSLVAMVFAFHTVEAYINFVGENLAPDLWADEQNYFRKQPYRGWNGKLRKVLELVNIEWAPDQRPLKTLLALKELRDAIAHGKAERFSDAIQPAPPDDGMPWLPTSRIRSMVTPKGTLDDMLTDVKALLDRIHKEAAPRINDPFHAACAVEGPSAWISRSTSLK